MLMLSRKPGEAIVLRRGDERIRIVVGEIRAGKARIGTEAAGEWEIVREELLERDAAAAAAESVR